MKTIKYIIVIALILVSTLTILNFVNAYSINSLFSTNTSQSLANTNFNDHNFQLLTYNGAYGCINLMSCNAYWYDGNWNTGSALNALDTGQVSYFVLNYSYPNFRVFNAKINLNWTYNTGTGLNTRYENLTILDSCLRRSDNILSIRIGKSPFTNVQKLDCLGSDNLWGGITLLTSNNTLSPTEYISLYEARIFWGTGVSDKENLSISTNPIYRYLAIPTISSYPIIITAYINFTSSLINNFTVDYINGMFPANLFKFNYSLIGGNKTNNLATILNGAVDGHDITSGCIQFSDFPNYCFTKLSLYADNNNYVNYSDININNYGFIENNQGFNINTSESSNEYFNINITYDYNNYGLTAYLIYNNISYLGFTNDSRETRIIYTNITIPDLSSANFYWNITLTNSSGNSNSYYSSVNTQYISKFIFSYCNQTVNISILNFTTIDELNNNLINSSFKGYFSYGVGSTGKNYSFEDLTQTNSTFYFCTNFNSSMKLSANIEYSASNYFTRNYYLVNSSISNPTLIYLRMINYTYGAKFFINVRKGINILSNYYININKHEVINDSYVSIGIRKTDNSGNIIEYLELDKSHRFFIYDSNNNFLGYIDKTSTCATSPCTIDLQLSDTSSDAFSSYRNFYGQNVSYSKTFNPITKIMSITYIDTTGLTSYVRFHVYQIMYNQTGNTICDNFLYSSSGTISCNLSGYTGNFRGDFFISRSPEKIIDSIETFVSSVKETLGLNGLLIALMLIVTTVLAVSWNPAVGLYIIPLDLVVLKWIEFLPLSWFVIAGITALCFWAGSKMRT